MTNSIEQEKTLLENSRVQGLVIDAICDTPLIFECTDRILGFLNYRVHELHVRRITFGHYLLIQRKMSEMGYQISAVTHENVLDVVLPNIKKTSEIIALSVCDTKHEINDLRYVEKLRKIVYRHFTLEAYCYALLGILEKCKTEVFTTFPWPINEKGRDGKIVVNHYKISDDLKRRDKQGEYESVGGRTLWGAFLQNVAKDYGWDFDTIVWGISYQNLMMMRLDEAWVDYDKTKPKTKTRATAEKPKTGKNVQKFEAFEDLLNFAQTI